MTYVQLDLLVVAGAAVLAVVGARAARRRQTPFVLPVVVTLALLVALTVVFDSLMISADLFRYDAAALLGVTLWHAPVEDLAWPVAAALALPSVWVLLAPVPARERIDA
ncbi:lycopene cyclase domain-containing protein [Cellulomonas sp. URHD0024]|uniref:lycopene cyclase domain-containing protein n=1 Tax=Cellulomonas sp. URHD0024 TaxID=1302620 RepID=UPI000406DF1A|nr:lycopene cyclase domain-containing protein [Cellulomonas sp. URHD0024]